MTLGPWCAATYQEVVDNDDEGNDKQYVDEPATKMCQQTEQP